MFKFLSPLEQFSIFPMQAIIIGPFDLSITNQAGILILLFVVLFAIFVGLTRHYEFKNILFLLILMLKTIPGKVIVKLKNPFKKFSKSLIYLYTEEFISILLLLYFQFKYFKNLFSFWYYFYQMMKVRSVIQRYGTNMFMWEGYYYIFNSSHAKKKSKEILLKTEYISEIDMEKIVYDELTYLNLHFLKKFIYSIYIWKMILVSFFKFLLFLFLVLLFI